jgi:NhaP-type Na+/H+ or K+/H+ antiporter
MAVSYVASRHRALVSVFSQEGTAILLGLVIGGLVFWWLSSLDEEILDEHRDRVKKLMNFGYLSGANYNKFILTSILVVLVVIAFLLASG